MCVQQDELAGGITGEKQGDGIGVVSVYQCILICI